MSEYGNMQDENQYVLNFIFDKFLDVIKTNFLHFRGEISVKPSEVKQVAGIRDSAWNSMFEGVEAKENKFKVRGKKEGIGTIKELYREDGSKKNKVYGPSLGTLDDIARKLNKPLPLLFQENGWLENYSYNDFPNPLATYRTNLKSIGMAGNRDLFGKKRNNGSVSAPTLMTAIKALIDNKDNITALCKKNEWSMVKEIVEDPPKNHFSSEHSEESQTYDNGCEYKNVSWLLSALFTRQKKNIYDDEQASLDALWGFICGDRHYEAFRADIIYDECVLTDTRICKGDLLLICTCLEDLSGDYGLLFNLTKLGLNIDKAHESIKRRYTWKENPKQVNPHLLWDSEEQVFVIHSLTEKDPVHNDYDYIFELLAKCQEEKIEIKSMYITEIMPRNDKEYWISENEKMAKESIVSYKDELSRETGNDVLCITCSMNWHKGPLSLYVCREEESVYIYDLEKFLYGADGTPLPFIRISFGEIKRSFFIRNRKERTKRGEENIDYTKKDEDVFMNNFILLLENRLIELILNFAISDGDVVIKKMMWKMDGKEFDNMFEYDYLDEGGV